MRFASGHRRAPIFRDRSDAGKRLGAAIAVRPALPDVVLGIPRGGVPVAFEVATTLGLPLDIVLVRKLGFPSQPEVAMGAIGEGGFRVLDEDLIRSAAIGDAELRMVETAENLELQRRGTLYRGGRPQARLSGQRVLIVDDGVATGSTAAVACRVARHAGARTVELAVPVAPSGWGQRMGDSADAYFALATPDNLSSVGRWYQNFSQTTDDEVQRLLEAAASPQQ
jgi:predicted phosphoribosyltransferase